MFHTALLALTGLMVGTAHADDDLEFDLEGYYRTRGHVFWNLYDGQEEAGRYMQQRLRLQPVVKYKDLAKVVMMADALDDVIWGDNQSFMPTSVFAQDPGYVGMSGDTVDWLGRPRDSIYIKRAWMEFTIPVGVVRVGRQESNWGMGILSNNGNGFDDTFGENHYGSTFDRVIFATRPIAIAQAAMGKEDSGIPFFTAIGVDRLVEDPLDLYYGYQCARETSGGDAIEQGMDEYNRACDPENQGYHTLEHSFVDETRTPDQRPDDWWVDNTDDAWELVMVAIYKGEDLDWGGSAADFTLGAYGIMRKHENTESEIMIADVYSKLAYRGLYFEFEGVNIRGKTSGIALRGAYDDSGNTKNPLYKDANIWGYANRIGYQQKAYTLMFEHGYASGDDNPADRPLPRAPCIRTSTSASSCSSRSWRGSRQPRGPSRPSRCGRTAACGTPGTSSPMSGTGLAPTGRSSVRTCWHGPTSPTAAASCVGRTMACSVSSRWTGLPRRSATKSTSR